MVVFPISFSVTTIIPLSFILLSLSSIVNQIGLDQITALFISKQYPNRNL